MTFLISALISYGVGALHALEPGHGKTVVAAYLVGSRGRVRDAIVLGVVVTLTHTSSVILLGILSSIAAIYFVPRQVHQVLEIVAGLLVVGVGGWMLWYRLRHGVMPHHEHDHEHELTHDPSHEHPAVAVGERLSLTGLITLGISGGIVPCPAALAVLLAAASTVDFIKAISLVVIFSLGMASVLVAIGILMVKAASFARARMKESPWTRRVPLISAAIVVLLGVFLTIRAIMHVAI